MRAVVRRSGKRTEVNGRRNSTGAARGIGLPHMQGPVVLDGGMEVGMEVGNMEDDN